MRRSLIFENNKEDKDMNKIIPALDMGKEDALELIEKLREVPELLAGLKVGSLLVYENSTSIIQEIKDLIHTPIIFDGQKFGTDIPGIAAEQVELLASAGADQIIACPMGAGPETLKAFTESCFANQVIPVCVVEMTHPQADAYLRADTARQVLKDALKFGIRNFVYPATKPETLRSHRGILNAQNGSVTLKATGFKVQGGSLSELRNLRVTEFIVGRAIYNAEDPAQAVIDLSKEING